MRALLLLSLLHVLLPSAHCWRAAPDTPTSRRQYGPFADTGLGAQCDYDEDCYVVEHTFCKMQQTCECKNGFVSSPSGDRCLATIGARCTTKYDCASLGSAGECRQNVCDCVSGYLPGPDDSCLKGASKLLETCQEDIQCQTLDATCVSGKCVCPAGHRAARDKCVVGRVLHEPCETSDQCYIGEEYKGIVKCTRGTCRCSENYSDTLDGKCSGSRRMGPVIKLMMLASLFALSTFRTL